MEDDRYYKALLEITEEQEKEATIPDKVKKYTHDIKGNKLPCEYVQLNQRYVHHLNKIPRHIAAKNDYFGLCFGYPGSGKTHHMIRTCLYLNADFGLKDIVFTIDELEEWIAKATPGSVCLFDEADVMAGNYYDEVLQGIIRNMKRIRTKQLVLFFCTPTMKDMHHFFSFRAKMVMYAYIPKNTDPSNRGYFHLWHDQDLIADLFARMKKSYSENSRVYQSAFKTIDNGYNGRKIAVDWPISEKLYEEKKEAARRALEASTGLTPKAAEKKERNTRIMRLDQAINTHNIKIAPEVRHWVFELSKTRYNEIIREGVVQ